MIGGDKTVDVSGIPGSGDSVVISKFHVFIGPLALLSVLIMETRKLAQTTSLRVNSQMKVVRTFETSGSNYTNNRRNIAEDLIL
jgi:hypothetical protein